ncbi:MAG TPA: MBL fold metallo-hydrolase [Bacteriovoracaceae bacterium]|nr:MBL fold metallo-hydrolase [Bacteriovoracaceae bacterium]
MNKITILGSGTSTGVPILGCNCQVCQSIEPRNKRLRTSALLQTETGKTIIIDTTPDLRTQLLLNKVLNVEGAIITHEHADHTHGMDDLRPFGFKVKNPIPIYTAEATAQELRKKFPYIFERHDKPILGGGIPKLNLEIISDGFHQVAGNEMEFFSLPHGHIKTLALRHSKMAYIVDCQSIPSGTIVSLRDDKLELLIIDCLREAPHDTHLHLDLTLEYIEKIAPRIAVLTHMGHELDYLALVNQLEKRGAKNVLPAIDGQSFLYS